MNHDLDETEPELRGCAEVARELGIGEAEVRAWARADGTVPRIGPVFVFRESDFDRLVDDLDDEAEYEQNADSEASDEDDDEDEDDDDDDEDDDDS